MISDCCKHPLYKGPKRILLLIFSLSHIFSIRLRITTHFPWHLSPTVFLKSQFKSQYTASKGLHLYYRRTIFQSVFKNRQLLKLAIKTKFLMDTRSLAGLHFGYPNSLIQKHMYLQAALIKICQAHQQNNSDVQSLLAIK